MRNYNLCVSLNPEEKALVTALAAKHNMKPTAYVKHLILSKENKPMMFIPGSDMSSEIGSKHQCIKAYFTDIEFKAIQHMANGEPLSRFVSRRALQGENVLNIKIEDDDYDFVFSVIEPIYTSIYLYLHNLKSIKAIDMDVIDKFIAEIEKTNDQLIQLTEYFKKNRASLRKSRLRELRKLSDFYLENYELISLKEE